jgi:WD40 repeat protein
MLGNRPQRTRPAACLAIGLLAAACSGQALTPTATPSPSPTLEVTPAGATATPQPIGAAPGRIIPVDAQPLPLNLAVIGSGNVAQLVRIGDLTAPGPSTSGASLAFLAPFEHSLVGHFDNGQTIVWDLASGAVSYQDNYPSDGDRFVENPPLAISPSYQGYLATAAHPLEVGEATNQRSVVIRTPDESNESFQLPVGTPGSDETGRVMSLAFAPDGSLLAVGIGGREGGVLQVWDISNPDDVYLLHLTAFGDEVTALQFAENGLALRAAVGNELISLEPYSGTELLSHPYDFYISGYATGPSGQPTAVWGSDRAVLASPSLQAELEIHAAREIRKVAFLPDERLAVVADGGDLHFWDLSTGAELVSFAGDPPHYPVLDVAVLGDGRLLATVDQSGRVSLWGVPAKQELPLTLTRISPTNAVGLRRAGALYVPGALEAVFSPATDWLAIGSMQGVYLVDFPSLELRQLLPKAGSGYTAFDVSESGGRLAWAAGPGEVKVWEFMPNRVVSEIAVPDENCCAQVLLTPNGELLVTLAGLTARVWDLATETELYSRQDVQRVEVSPDGSQLAFESAVELRVSIWDRSTGQDVRQLTGFETAAPVYGARFSPGWRWMYWASRASMQFSEVGSGALGAFVPFSWGAFSPREDRIAVVEEGWIYQTVGQAIVLDLRSGETLAVLDHHADAIVQSIAYSPDGSLIATALGPTIKIWDALSGAELATLPPAGGSVHDLAFSQDGRLLLSLAEGDLVELWAVMGGLLPEPQPEAGVIGVGNAASVVPQDSLRLEQAATDAVFSPDGTTVAVSTGSGAIWYWDLTRDESTEVPLAHSDWVYRLAFAPAGSRLASVSKDGSLRLRGPSPSPSAASVSLPSELSALAFLPDGQTLVSGGQDQTLRFWDLSLQKPVLEIPTQSGWSWGLSISPAGDWLASASANRTITLWRILRDPIQVRQERTLTGHSATVWDVDFSPNGRALASASWDRTVRLWDVNTGLALASLEGHADWAYSVDFSPDGGLVASSSADGTIRLWDVAGRRLLATLEGSGGPIWSVEFSPDGRYLVSASEGGQVVLWGLAP